MKHLLYWSKDWRSGKTPISAHDTRAQAVDAAKAILRAQPTCMANLSEDCRLKTGFVIAESAITHSINETLGHYVTEVTPGNWALFNQFGYSGLFASLDDALRANDSMGVEPASA